MKQTDLDKIIAFRCGKIADVLKSKNREYAPGDDALHNFKRAGQMLGQSPESALVGFWAKHIVSILDIVNDLPGPGESMDYLDIDLVDEKIGDAINYLVLLESLIKERKGNI